MLYSSLYHQYELLEVNFFVVSTPTPPPPSLSLPTPHYSKTAAYASLFLATESAIFEQIDQTKSGVLHQFLFKLSGSNP